MGVRIGRIAPVYAVCAVVVALASGCVVGPTIDDERSGAKAAGSERTGNPTYMEGQNTPSTGGGSGEATPSPGSPAVDDGPKAGDIGFGAAFVPVGGDTSVVVTEVHPERNVTPQPGQAALRVRMRVLNGRAVEFRASGMLVSIVEGKLWRKCQLVVPPGGTTDVRVPAGVNTMVSFSCTRAGPDTGGVRIAVGLLVKGDVVFAGNITATGSGGPAEGPATQPTTRIVPPSSPRPTASASTSARASATARASETASGSGAGGVGGAR